MNRALAAWKWSLGIVARSYRTVVALAVLMAAWAFAAYAWLGLAESSAPLLILALLWAIVQMLAALMVLGGIVSGAAETAATEDRYFPLRVIWTRGGKKFATTLLFGAGSLALVWWCATVFDWIDEHALEVASFLTFHSSKPVSHVTIADIYGVVELLLWTVVGGILLSFFMVLRRDGWRGAAKRSAGLLAACAFRTPFLTSLLSALVFGGLSYELATWHPHVPPGFWDYVQMIGRFSAALILISAGALFWSLSLARLILPKQNPPEAT